jgi:hypothetical protein
MLWLPRSSFRRPRRKFRAEAAWAMGGSTAVIVTGGTNNNYYSIGGMRYLQVVQIDRWR